MPYSNYENHQQNNDYRQLSPDLQWLTPIVVRKDAMEAIYESRDRVSPSCIDYSKLKRVMSFNDIVENCAIGKEAIEFEVFKQLYDGETFFNNGLSSKLIVRSWGDGEDDQSSDRASVDNISVASESEVFRKKASGYLRGVEDEQITPDSIVGPYIDENATFASCVMIGNLLLIGVQEGIIPCLKHRSTYVSFLINCLDTCRTTVPYEDLVRTDLYKSFIATQI